MFKIFRKLRKALKNSTNLFHGFNIYASREKFKLIKNVFENFLPQAHTFADLGGVWKVDAAYTIYTLKNFNVKKGFIVDTDFSSKVSEKLNSYKNLVKINGNFGDEKIITQIGNVDVIYFFDVLLHQVAPDWDEILKRYSEVADCFVIYNQQFINSDDTIRLTDLPLEQYKEFAPQRKDDLYDFIFGNRNEINKEYNKPWKDIHNIWQWGITDKDLRERMKLLRYKEVYYKNYGQFSDSKFFEDHAFIYLKT